MTEMPSNPISERGSRHTRRLTMDLSGRGTYVRCVGPRLSGDSCGAQLADISLTGMRLISRQPLHMKRGDFMTVEFSLAGQEKHMKRQVRVVRAVNDFVFAVRFIGMEPSDSEELGSAIARHSHLVQKKSGLRSLDGLRNWIVEHRSGLLLSLAGLLFIGAMAAWIILGSDEYLGREIRPWGSGQPKQWYWDYIKHFSQF